jgi:mono/diheme cytochrome c family protein
MHVPLLRFGPALIAAAFVASLALAAPRPRATADDDEAEARFFGRRTFEENCRICHGEDMSSRQRLTPNQWTAEVEKMVGWGATVPPDQKANLLDYLVSSFPDKAPPPPLETVTAADILAEDEALVRRPAALGDASKGVPLYAQHCALCHGTSGQGADLGPRLALRPILLDALGHLETVRKGRGRMPGFSAALKPADEEHILAWLRSLH